MPAADSRIDFPVHSDRKSLRNPLRQHALTVSGYYKIQVKNMQNKLIITDSNDAPRIRFLKVIFSSMECEGYKFLKSQNSFVKNFDNGKKVIRFSFNNTMGYIGSLNCFVYIVFDEVEKIFKKILPDYGWTNWTLCNNMDWVSPPLYNDNTEEYTDESINNAANHFFKNIKPRIDEMFNSSNSNLDLHNIFNISPTKYNSYFRSLRVEKRIIHSLILTSIYEPNALEKTLEKHINSLNNYDKDELETIQNEISIAFKYLENNKIKITEHMK